MLTIAVPLYNEEESVGPLIEAVRFALAEWRSDWELVLVDDGSRDGTAAVAEEAAGGDPRIRLVRLSRNFGQSAAMQAGFDHAYGDVVVTMDGDLQNDPRDIPMLVDHLDAGWDIVAGYREHRQDVLLSRRIPSRIANALLRWVTGVAVRDTGCSLKAYRRDVLDRIRLYSDFHRFIPALAVAIAGARITELPVRHHARRFGQSKYGISRVFKVLADLVTLVMLRRFLERPLLLFGVLGLAGLMAAVSAFAGAFRYTGASAVGDTGIILGAVALTYFELGVFLLLVGFFSEVLLHMNRDDDSMRSLLLREVRG